MESAGLKFCNLQWKTSMMKSPLLVTEIQNNLYKRCSSTSTRKNFDLSLLLSKLSQVNVCFLHPPEGAYIRSAGKMHISMETEFSL